MFAVLDEQKQSVERLRRQGYGLIVTQKQTLGRVQPEGTKFIEVLSFRHVRSLQKIPKFSSTFPKDFRHGLRLACGTTLAGRVAIRILGDSGSMLAKFARRSNAWLLPAHGGNIMKSKITIAGALPRPAPLSLPVFVPAVALFSRPSPIPKAAPRSSVNEGHCVKVC